MTKQTNVVQALRTLLATGDEADRCNACRALGTLADPRAVPALAERLRDEDIDVCADAAAALGRLGDHSAGGPLLDSLRDDPNPEVKTAALEALIHLGAGDARVISCLTALAEDRPADMLSGGDSIEGCDWDPWWDMQRIAVTALGRMQASKAVPVLTGILDDEYLGGESIEAEVLTALARIGGSGAAAVMERLRNGSARQRRRAARALGEAHTVTGLEALAGALEDPAGEVRAAAIDSLARRQAGRYAHAVLAHLKDPDPEVRRTAIGAVAALTGGAGLDYGELLALVDDDSAQVRAASLRLLYGALDEGRDAECWQAVQPRLADPDAEAAAAACQLAGRLNVPHACAALLAVLADDGRDGAVRSQAARALGHRAEAADEVLQGLVRTLGDKVQTVRLAALNALMDLSMATDTAAGGAHGDQPPTPLDLMLGALRGELHIEEAEAEQETPSTEAAEAATPRDPLAAAAPGAIPADSAVPANGSTADLHAPDLAAVLRDYADADEAPETEPRRGALSTLEAVAMDNVESVLSAEAAPEAADEDTAVIQLPEEQKKEIAEYLDLMQKQKATWTRLTKPKILDVATDVRVLSARLLGACGRPEVVAALIESLRDGQPEIRKEAVESLARIARRAPQNPGLPGALGPLVTFLTLAEPELRQTSIQALGALGEPDALPPLMECLEDDDPVVRSHAVQALAALAASAKGRPGIYAVIDGNTIDEVAQAVMNRLDDGDTGVQKAAAQALAALGAAVTQAALREDIGARLIRVGLGGEGGPARDMGRVLRVFDPERGGALLTDKLTTLPTSLERGRAIEMLEEIYRPATT